MIMALRFVNGGCCRFVETSRRARLASFTEARPCLEQSTSLFYRDHAPP